MDLPSGTVTFFFSDVVGSTRLWEAAPTSMGTALARHDQILRDAVHAHGGYVFATGGDGFAAAFARAGDAVAAAVSAQARLGTEHWPDGAAIRVRIGVHTGEAEERDGGYFGAAVNRTARLMAIAHGGQTLVSAVTAALLEPGTALRGLGRHRLADVAEAQEVFQVGDGRFPPLRSPEVLISLPTPLTALIGRGEEVARLSTLVTTQRLVTLTGVGGVGKTRLALAVAAACAGAFPDGVWFVDLAAANDQGEAEAAIATTLGVPATDRTALSRYLTDRRVLLVLDNCEHVLAEVADVAEFTLAATTDVVILATSRQPLGIVGEAVREVRPLALPDPDADVVEAETSAGVELFVQRAASASGSFALDEDNTAVVVGICRRLDGIPLAIELAAARVRTMTPREIAHRLGDRFSLLSASTGFHSRHRTLEAALSWSHDLLSDDERRVFRRLGVFPASFDLAAAEAVADADGNAIECVLGLVDRSLVRYEPEGGRYRLIETVREYARDRLADAGETDVTRDRHAQFYFALASRSDLDERPDGGSSRIAKELDNLRAVVGWLSDQHRGDELVRLCRAAFGVLLMTAPTDGLLWYRRALDCAETIDLQQHVDALGELGMLSVSTGVFDGEGTWRASIDLAEAEHLLPSPQAWHARSVALIVADDRDNGRLAAEMTIAIADDRGEPYSAAVATGTLAGILASVGELHRSAELAGDALRRARRISDIDQRHHVITIAALSWLVYRTEPDFQEAMRVLIDNPVDLESVQPGTALWRAHAFGLAHLGLGHVDAAIHSLTRALRLTDRTGHDTALDQGARALAVAYRQARHTTVAAEIVGYAETHLSANRPLIPIHNWLEKRLTAPADEVGAAEWARAVDIGSQLDRRGFMRLITRAEQDLVEPPLTVEDSRLLPTRSSSGTPD